MIVGRIVQGLGAAAAGPSTLALLTTTITDPRARLDLPGAVTGTVGVAALVYGFIRAADPGWTGALTLTSLIAGAVLIGVFLVVETRSAQPLLPLRLFADRNRAAAYANFFFGPMVLTGLGMGLAFAPLNVIIMGSVPASDAGAAGGVLQTMQQTGATLGLAILVTIFGTVTRDLTGSPHDVLVWGMTAAFTGSVVIACLTFVVALTFRRDADRAAQAIPWPGAPPQPTGPWPPRRRPHRGGCRLGARRVRYGRRLAGAQRARQPGDEGLPLPRLRPRDPARRTARGRLARRRTGLGVGPQALASGVLAGPHSPRPHPQALLEPTEVA
ncbi:hypothetical protein GCM10027445_08810 [Amycolatopsis endophytica]